MKDVTRLAVCVGWNSQGSVPAPRLDENIHHKTMVSDGKKLTGEWMNQKMIGLRYWFDIGLL